MTSIELRTISADEAPKLLEWVRELEREEGFPFEAPVTAEALQNNLLATDGPGIARFVVAGGQEVGYVVYYFTFSTAEGKPGLHLDDLYIAPEFRRKGYGVAAMKELASIASDKGCARMEWWTLRWNDPAKEFYKALEAGSKDDILIYRMGEDQIKKLKNNINNKE